MCSGATDFCVFYNWSIWAGAKKQSSHFRMLCKEHKSVFGCIGITVSLYLHVTSFGQSYSVRASFPASAVNIWHIQPSSDMWGPSSDSSPLLEHNVIFYKAADKNDAHANKESFGWVNYDCNSFSKAETCNQFPPLFWLFSSRELRELWHQ